MRKGSKLIDRKEMNAASLLASAGMNIGLALVVLSLFSVLKKQPCSAPVYFARRIARREALPLYPAFSLARLRPTASWISRAFRITEDEVLRIQGLDALVVLRLFKFGIVYRGPEKRSPEDRIEIDDNSLIERKQGRTRRRRRGGGLGGRGIGGLAEEKVEDKEEKTEEALRGSDDSNTHSTARYGLIFTSLMANQYADWVTSESKILELPVAFVSFKSRCGAAFAAQTQQHIHPLLWTTEAAPEPRDVIWKNLAIPCHLLALYRTGIFIAALLLTVFFALPVTAVQGIAQFENLKKWFPPARAVQIIPEHSLGWGDETVEIFKAVMRSGEMLRRWKRKGCVWKVRDNLANTWQALYVNQVAKENDDCDEREGELQANQEIAINAYHPPWMRPVSFAGDAAYMKPLVNG
ncbi:hypothetical protein MUK42_18597 [Musa troglodytarum]|uniref:CSC1/OSCA1-like N-terminal transmembrane domain-containing protein n=1 Tax=Musa troglodytarum TaxID=320322 RepID=A0A9E7EVM9_9LILI|nr:hypothetical protein MUK42_18597 [Musa troglodytarum]